MVDAKLTDSQSGSNLKRCRLSKSSFANSVRSDALRTYRGTDLLTATPSRRATRRRSASMSDQLVVGDQADSLADMEKFSDNEGRIIWPA